MSIDWGRHILLGILAIFVTYWRMGGVVNDAISSVRDGKHLPNNQKSGFDFILSEWRLVKPIVSRRFSSLEGISIFEAQEGSKYGQQSILLLTQPDTCRWIVSSNSSEVLNSESVVSIFKNESIPFPLHILSISEPYGDTSHPIHNSRKATNGKSILNPANPSSEASVVVEAVTNVNGEVQLNALPSLESSSSLPSSSSSVAPVKPQRVMDHLPRRKHSTGGGGLLASVKSLVSIAFGTADVNTIDSSRKQENRVSTLDGSSFKESPNSPARSKPAGPSLKLNVRVPIFNVTCMYPFESITGFSYSQSLPVCPDSGAVWVNEALADSLTTFINDCRRLRILNVFFD